jgi:hypothetical protein
MREGGNPIGSMRSPEKVRALREEWALGHDTHSDRICSANCLDVCRDYANRYREFHIAAII